MSPLSMCSFNQPLFLQKTKPLDPNSKHLFGVGNCIWDTMNLGFSHRVSIVRANMHNQICYLKFIRWASNSKTGLVISSALPPQQQKIKTKPCGNIWTHISASCVLLSHLLFPSIKINIKQRIKTVKKFWAGDHWAGNWRRADLENI